MYYGFVNVIRETYIINDSRGSTRRVFGSMTSMTFTGVPVLMESPSVTASYSRTDSLMEICTFPVPFRS